MSVHLCGHWFQILVASKMLGDAEIVVYIRLLCAKPPWFCHGIFVVATFQLCNSLGSRASTVLLLGVSER